MGRRKRERMSEGKKNIIGIGNYMDLTHWN